MRCVYCGWLILQQGNGWQICCTYTHKKILNSIHTIHILNFHHTRSTYLQCVHYNNKTHAVKHFAMGSWSLSLSHTHTHTQTTNSHTHTHIRTHARSKTMTNVRALFFFVDITAIIHIFHMCMWNVCVWYTLFSSSQFILIKKKKKACDTHIINIYHMYTYHTNAYMLHT